MHWCVVGVCFATALLLANVRVDRNIARSLWRRALLVGEPIALPAPSRTTKGSFHCRSATSVLRAIQIPPIALLAMLSHLLAPIHHRGNRDATGIGRESEGHEGTAGGVNQTAILPQAGVPPANRRRNPERGQLPACDTFKWGRKKNDLSAD